MSGFKIGDTIYFRDCDGRNHGEGLPKGWKAIQIREINRTTVFASIYAFDKKTLKQTHLKGHSGGFAVGSMQEVNLHEWSTKNRPHVVEDVRQMANDELKKVADFIGFKERA